MNRAAPLVFLSGFVAVVLVLGCASKHQDRPPILTECGSNDQSCSGNGTGSSSGSSVVIEGGTDADSAVIDTGAPVDDAGLAFDSGLSLAD